MSILTTVCALTVGCAASTDAGEEAAADVEAIEIGHCNQAQPKDVLIAALMKDSVAAGYPLTRLSVDGSGLIVGAGAPDLVAGHLELINSVPDARDSVARALNKIGTLPDYEVTGLGPDTEACTAIPAWTPTGTTTVSTTENEVFVGPNNADSWTKVHREFGKECPLVKRLGNRDVIDPPGDGSTNAPVSATVSATGVTANAFGNCPTSTTAGTYCKLSYATGVNYTGRTCTWYYSSLRCLLY